MARRGFATAVVGAAVLAFAAGAVGLNRLAEVGLAPGPLARDHSDAPCLSCHAPLRRVSAAGCQAAGCHPSAELARARPATVAVHEDARKNGLACQACHPEHRGRGAELTIAFHRQPPAPDQKDCARCHLTQGRRAHADIKERDCALCHLSTEDWKQVRFEHRDLRGKGCADCHEAPADDLHRRLSPSLVVSACGDCHRDTAHWRAARFDHALLSQAVVRDCESCHRLPAGALHASARGIACSRCHSTRFWEPSTFRHPRIPEFREHMESLSCRDCHPRSLSSWVSCRECHGRGGFFED